MNWNPSLQCMHYSSIPSQLPGSVLHNTYPGTSALGTAGGMRAGGPSTAMRAPGTTSGRPPPSQMGRMVTGVSSHAKPGMPLLSCKQTLVGTYCWHPLSRSFRLSLCARDEADSKVNHIIGIVRFSSVNTPLPKVERIGKGVSCRLEECFIIAGSTPASCVETNLLLLVSQWDENMFYQALSPVKKVTLRT